MGCTCRFSLFLLCMSNARWPGKCCFFVVYIQIKWGAAEKWLIVSGNRLAGGSKLIFNQFDIPSLGFFKVKNQIHLREGGSINWLWFVHKKFNRTVCCLFNVPLWAAARCLPLCMHACVGCWIFLRISRYQAVKRNICHSSDSMEAILPYNSGWWVKYIFELYLLYRFILYVRPAAEIYAKTNLVKCKIIYKYQATNFLLIIPLAYFPVLKIISSWTVRFLAAWLIVKVSESG